MREIGKRDGDVGHQTGKTGDVDGRGIRRGGPGKVLVGFTDADERLIGKRGLTDNAKAEGGNVEEVVPVAQLKRDIDHPAIGAADREREGSGHRRTARHDPAVLLIVGEDGGDAAARE